MKIKKTAKEDDWARRNDKNHVLAAAGRRAC